MFSIFSKKTQSNTLEKVPVSTDYSNIERVAEYFKKETGVTFETQMSILSSKVITFCKLREIHSFSILLEKVKDDSSLKQEMIDYLTTNESYFYRELKQINNLVDLVKDESEIVTILCAPSSTGEEPYSIAIALLEAGVTANKFKITGIDINQEALEKSKIAVYRQRNVKNLSTEILSKYFTQDDEKYNLTYQIKNVVHFRLANIFDDSFKSLGKFDYIFSRNMLIYFDKETKLKAKTILESMRRTDKHDVFFGHADLF